MNKTELAKMAAKARERAYAPYSNYLVGAALLAKSGKIYLGCNIENSAHSSTVCAERTAFFKAISEGEGEFDAVAVAGWPRNSKKPAQAFPCGVCRQVMKEFCKPDFTILVATDEKGGYTEHSLDELLPHSFGPESLE